MGQSRGSKRRRNGESADSVAIAEVCDALRHPTRVAVLLAVASGRVNPARFARARNASITAVAHHFRVLEAAQILREAGTQLNRGTVEHHYEVTSRGRAIANLLPPIAAAARTPRRRR